MRIREVVWRVGTPLRIPLVLEVGPMVVRRRVLVGVSVVVHFSKISLSIHLVIPILTPMRTRIMLIPVPVEVHRNVVTIVIHDGDVHVIIIISTVIGVKRGCSVNVTFHV
jgi:hypothetical protein